jgi:hypothetical protein
VISKSVHRMENGRAELNVAIRLRVAVLGAFSRAASF